MHRTNNLIARSQHSSICRAQMLNSSSSRWRRSTRARTKVQRRATATIKCSSTRFLKTCACKTPTAPRTIPSRPNQKRCPPSKTPIFHRLSSSCTIKTRGVQMLSTMRLPMRQMTTMSSKLTITCREAMAPTSQSILTKPTRTLYNRCFTKAKTQEVTC